MEQCHLQTASSFLRVQGMVNLGSSKIPSLHGTLHAWIQITLAMLSSEENNMRVRMEFSPDIDVNTAANDVREALSRITSQLPENLDQLLVIKADGGDGG